MVKRIINALPVGSSLQNGKYVILKALGQGSFGITYLAKMKTKVEGSLGAFFTDSNVAIKEFFMKDYSGRQGTNVSCSGSLHTDYMRKFRREAEHLSHFRHDNIVKVLELFEENNTLYYVMEYIEGGSLDDHIPQNIGLPEQETLSLARQVGKALSYMHGRKALHLDLKPNNIMLRDDGRPVLIDFGLTKQYTEEGEPESSTTIGLGTRGYAPMEQANYQKDKTFAPTLDIYAFGATIFKMLTGLTPPEADRIFNEGFPTSWLTERKVSDATIQIVQKCMAPRKADRYQTIDAILKDISKIEGNKSDQTHKGKETEDEKTIIDDQDNRKQTDRGRKQDDTETSSGASVSSATNTIAGHEYVDLGLSVKWATCNVGANKPEDYGSYFAWGEICDKETYTEENSMTYGKSFGDISGNSAFDAAKANWGSTWRMPKEAEFQELIDNCDWTWTTYDGTEGYKVVRKKNNNSIFLPAAGFCDDSSFNCVGEGGFYWSSTPHENDADFACYLFFRDGLHYVYRYFLESGRSVRPVSE